MRVLVIGANGQLGSAAAAELVRRGHQVRGTVRRPERGAGLADAGVEVAVADLTSSTGLSGVLDDVECVLLTASPAAPRAGDDLTATQRALERVVTDAEKAGVRRFCLASIPRSTDRGLPLERDKGALEDLLLDSSMEPVVLRLPPFMEVWLALVGSSLPSRGEPHATVDRPAPFLHRFRRLTGTLVEDRGVMLVPGSPGNRNAFIAIADVASCCATALERPDLAGADLEVGGPEVLSWSEVARIFGEVLGRKVRCVSTPGAVYAAMAAALRPIAPVPSMTMALNQLAAEMETPWSPGGAGLIDPAAMTTVQEFLSRKARLPR